MNSRRQALTNGGFTLMEIMVVIIVIAVLSSIAGPMLNALTDQGKASATKAGMQNLKTALVNFNSDLGKFPFIGANGAFSSAYGTAAQSAVLGTTEGTNVLISDAVGGAYANLGISSGTYSRRWKGPYMDADPNNFMVDAWESGIRYHYHKKGIYLWSAGPDGQFEADFNTIASGTYEGDDLVQSVSKVLF